MARTRIGIGELLTIHSGYVGGVWLRPDNKKLSYVDDANRLLMPGQLVLALKTDGHDVLVIGDSGIVGWTIDNRLKKLNI